MAKEYEYTGTPGSSASLAIDSIFVNVLTTTSIEVTISKTLMTEEPTSYTIVYQKLNDDYTNNGSPVSANYDAPDEDEIPKYEITGLTANSIYTVKVKANKGTQFSNWISDAIKTTNASFNGVVVGGLTGSQKISASKSYLKITAPTVKNEFAIATRKFDAITVPTVASSSSQGPSYATKYYSFGTSLFMDSITTSPKQGSGVGFFTNSEGSKGYFVVVETTGLSASQDRKSIRIIKTDGTKVFNLKDSQQSTVSTFEGVYGGSQYNLDIRVKVSGRKVEMIVYVNGYKILASDETSGSNYIVAPSQNVALLTTSGTTAFDYIYGTDIDEETYLSSAYSTNFYEGQFSNDTLSTSFGDMFYYANQGDDVYATKKASIEEFGTTVREIVKANVKFASRPSFPVRWSTGTNRLVKILGSKLNNFGGEAYLLNNTSTTVPLSDENLASFYVIGNTLAPSGQIEYSTEDNDYTAKEPVVFESRWLQNESDVKSLAAWIKSNVVNKGKVVEMSVFGNPTLAVGDIVSINYPYQGFAGTEKFMIVRISQSYSDGLETSITCRLISA